MKMNLLNIVLFILIQLFLKSYGESPSFELFAKNNKFIDVSNYAVSNGFPNFDSEFNNFKIKYKRNYTKEEEEKRKYYFMNTLIAIEKNKQQLQNGEVYYELAINKFADILPDEKLQMGNNWINRKNVSFTEQFDKNRHISDIDKTKLLPKNFDWRDKDVVTKVKDQGACGSCWAFAAIATIESAYAIKNNITADGLIRLSEQEMVDCVSGGPYISQGCYGGTVYDVYRYIHGHGVVQENDYRYVQQDQRSMPCHSTTGKWKTKINDYFVLTSDISDNDIMHTIYNKGPVAVLINAGDEDFSKYSKGIITTPGNRNTINNPTNHYITCVGWGTEGVIDYWIIKNSYGSDWGETGYFRLKRGINSRGFNTVVLYPTLQKSNDVPIVEPDNPTVEPDNPTTQEPNDSMKVKYSSLFNLSLFAFIISYFKFFIKN